jgi:hypothetical protein
MQNLNQGDVVAWECSVWVVDRLRGNDALLYRGQGEDKDWRVAPTKELVPYSE